MAHTGIFATSSEILTKAGANYSTGVTEAKINELCLQAESQINVECQVNFSDDFTGLNADVKGLLTLAESNLVAMYIISYDMSGYTSRAETSLMLNVLRDGYQNAIAKLRDKTKTDWMAGQ